MRKLFFTGAGFVFLLLLTGGIAAQTTAKGALAENTAAVVSGEQYAVIIGISKYKYLPSLQYADADAKNFADFLINTQGVKEKNVHLFLNDSATLGILSQFAAIKKQVKPGDRIYIYFSGHGDIETEMQQGGLLLLYESSAESYYLNPNGYIQESQLRAIIGQLTRAQAEVIFIADACHSGRLSGGDEGRRNNVLALKEAWGNEVKIFSCQANEVSLEGKQWGNGRGLFSWHLINGLKGAADSADVVDQKISLLELQTYLQNIVRTQAKPGKQTPFVTGNLDMVLCKATGLNAIGAGDRLLSAEISTGKKGSASTLGGGQATLYSRFNAALSANNLNGNADAALPLLNKMKEQRLPEETIEDATRNLVAALLKESSNLINPLIAGDEIITAKQSLEQTIADMETAMALLGTDHYLWPAFESRRLFLKSIAITLTEEDAAKKENVNQAIQWLEQSVKVEPYAYYSYFQLGVNYYRKKLADKAIEYFNKYRSYLPKDGDTYNNIGLAYFKLRNAQEAVKYIAKAISMDSTRAAYYFNMGNIMCAAGDYARGVYAYRKALKCEPDYPNVYFNVGAAFSSAGYHDSAARYFKLVLNKTPGDGLAWQYLGNAQKKLGKSDEAIKAYTNAIKTGNNAFRIYYNMACLLSLNGDKENALNFLEDALKRGMNDFVLEIYQNAELNNIRNTARFTALMKKYAAK